MQGSIRRIWKRMQAWYALPSNTYNGEFQKIMGYKLAGFDVIGCNEIDPKVNQVYVTNHAPRFNFLGDIRELRERERESYRPNFTAWIFWTAHPHVPLSPYPAIVKRIGAKKKCSERGKRHKFLIRFSSTS